MTIFWLAIMVIAGMAFLLYEFANAKELPDEIQFRENEARRIREIAKRMMGDL